MRSKIFPILVFALQFLSPLVFEVHSNEVSSKFLIGISKSPNDLEVLCTEYPNIAQDIINIGKKLGVKFLRGKPLIIGKDATYEAENGKLGTIIMTTRTMSPQVYCQLVTHEFIHVLQHLNGNLKAVKPIGLEIPLGYLELYGSLQEAEAYGYQNRASEVLKSLEKALIRK